MIASRSPKRSKARAWRCWSQSRAICSSSSWCSAVSSASYPSDSARMTSPRRAERRSISFLISLSVPMTRTTPGPSGIFLRIPELVEPVLVDAEVVGELVEDRDPDLLLELRRVGERLHERLAEDRDLVRHVLGGLPEAEQVGVVRVLLLDDHGDVLERPRQLWRQRVERPRQPWRQRVERPPDMPVEAHARRAASGGRTWNALTARTPKRNPPTCAANATPPACDGCVSEKFASQSWSRNHTARKKPADSRQGRQPTLT